MLKRSETKREEKHTKAKKKQKKKLVTQQIATILQKDRRYSEVEMKTENG